MSDLEKLFHSPYPDFESPTFCSHSVSFPWLPFSLDIQLISKHRLWAHHIWNAGKVAAQLLFKNQHEWVQGKNVIEFGAASAIPSIIAARLHASFVCATDYPDNALIENIHRNFNVNCTEHNWYVCGHEWGSEVSELIQRSGGKKYDLVILSDLVFNHVAHRLLLKSVSACLNENVDALVLVTFTPHRPALYEDDRRFFKIAEEEFGFVVEQHESIEMGVMFEEDQGDAKMRGTVFVYTMRLNKN